MAFLIGVGDEAALKYRILPVSRFMNIGARPSRATPCVHAPAGCATPSSEQDPHLFCPLPLIKRRIRGLG